MADIKLSDLALNAVGGAGGPGTIAGRGFTGSIGFTGSQGNIGFTGSAGTGSGGATGFDQTFMLMGG